MKQLTIIILGTLVLVAHVVLVLCALAMPMSRTPAGAGVRTDTGTGVSFPYCASEDETGCVWDGSANGNHTGRSFVAGVDGNIAYLD
jgi:hypothetical protein